MSKEILLTQNELLEHLTKQYRLLHKSVKEFCEGDEDEVQRIATIIRLLMHDTRFSRSLLQQVCPSIMLLDSAQPMLESNCRFESDVELNQFEKVYFFVGGMVSMCLSDNTAWSLQLKEEPRWVTREVWWN